jgi:hypothetical protein
MKPAARSSRLVSFVVGALLVGACTTTSSATPPTVVPTLSASLTAPSSASPSPLVPSPSPSPEVVRTRFAGRISPIPPAVESEMRGTTWKPGCPVPISGLRLLRFNYLGFDDVVKRGELVVNAGVADDVLWVFHQLFDARFPLRKVGLARKYVAGKEDPNDRHDVTASFNCRPAITPSGPTSTFSQHAYGLAVDVNPLQNPEVGPNGEVRNNFARVYRDRSLQKPGMIHPGDVVVRSFAAIGWKWGGYWSSFKDYMHFSQSGT